MNNQRGRNKGSLLNLDIEGTTLARKKKKTKKKKKKEAIWLDLESPYAEYLPALYREWAPKEPRLSTAVGKDNSIREQ